MNDYRDNDNSQTKLYLPSHIMKIVKEDESGKRRRKFGERGKKVDEEKERERIEEIVNEKLLHVNK